MKYYILSFFVIVISICSCKKTVLNIKEQHKDIFSPALKKEILRMIDAKNNKTMQLKVCNVVILQDITRDAMCSVIISWNNSILKKTIPFVPPSDSLNIHVNSNVEIIGYTFMESELIICYLLSDSCNNNIINKKELIPYSDSIPGYPDIAKDYSDRTFERPTCIYKIVGDSLQLIKSEWIF